MEDWVRIRNIRSKNPTLGTSKIAELLGISRNTVKQALSCDEALEYNRGVTKINEQVEPFEVFIKESFLKKNLKASHILKDIQSKGYKLSQYALYAMSEDHSRYKSFDVTLSITQSDFINALEESFALFGGVCERIQVDNARRKFKFKPQHSKIQELVDRRG